MRDSCKSRQPLLSVKTIRKQKLLQIFQVKSMVTEWWNGWEATEGTGRQPRDQHPWRTASLPRQEGWWKEEVLSEPRDWGQPARLEQDRLLWKKKFGGSRNYGRDTAVPRDTKESRKGPREIPLRLPLDTKGQESLGNMVSCNMEQNRKQSRMDLRTNLSEQPQNTANQLTIRKYGETLWK